MENRMSLTYKDYLKLDQLLSLQQPRSTGKEHDELLFIVIHQAYELWFKQILHELDFLNSLFMNDDVEGSLKVLKRILSIMKVQLSQMNILETMTFLEFQSFRDYLDTASGFQSFQFRELEFALGFKSQKAISAFPEDGMEQKRLKIRIEAPSLFDAFLNLISLRGYDVPEDILNRDITRPLEPCKEVRDSLTKIYHDDSLLAYICELLTDLDEDLQQWRYKHVKMVERIIGGLPGTGGSSGVDYLKSTLFRPVFPDLWSIRSNS